MNTQGQFIAAENGQSCEEACQPGYVCDNTQMQFINDCSVMKQHYPCQRGCWNEVSNAVPSYCKGETGYGGMCLVSQDAFATCKAQLKGTYRLCYCLPKESVVTYSHKTPEIRMARITKKNQ